MADILISGSIGAAGSFAILGEADVTIVSNTDLVLSQGQYTNYVLRVFSDGTLTGDKNVIAPLFKGETFIVQNLTSEGHNIILKGASGTGVTVAHLANTIVFCDGANYMQATAAAGPTGPVGPAAPAGPVTPCVPVGPRMP